MNPTTRVLVTTPDARQFVTDSPIDVADRTYGWESGYEIRVVRGFTSPHGFVVRGASRPDQPQPQPQEATR